MGRLQVGRPSHYAMTKGSQSTQASPAILASGELSSNSDLPRVLHCRRAGQGSKGTMVYTVHAEAGSRDACKAQITGKFAKVDVKLAAVDKALSTPPFKKVRSFERSCPARRLTGCVADLVRVEQA